MSDGAKRDILHSTSLIGGVTAASLLISLARMKVIAALVGPAGVGLLGLLTNILALGVAVFGMALDSSGVRQLSAARDDPRRLRITTWSVWTFAFAASFLAMLMLWAFRAPIARSALGSVEYGSAVAWIGVGVGVSIVGMVQLAAIQAFQRLGDLARLRMIAAVLGALASIAAVYLWKEEGILVAVLALPVATALVGMNFIRRIPRGSPGGLPAPAELRPEWTALVTLGAAVTAAAAIGTASQTGVRALLTQELGLASAGLFQASFALSSLNLGLVLSAMIPDYYPRLSAAADRPDDLERIVNDQLHVGLILAAPALIAISAAAPLLLRILYTSQFADAALLLRLQVSADVLRVPGWALGYLLLARRRTIAYILVEAAFAIVFLPSLWLLVPRIGLAAAGITYFAGYVASLLVAAVVANRNGIRITRANGFITAVTCILLLAIAGISTIDEAAATLVAAAALLIAGLGSIREIARIGPSFIPPSLLAFLRRGLQV